MNTYLDERPCQWNELHDPCYFKIYLNREWKATIACLQSFDEVDYDQNRFYKNEKKECIAFYKEENAIAFLNDKFKQEYIDPLYLNDDNLFHNMLKELN